MKDAPLAAAAPLATNGPRFVRLDLCRVTIRQVDPVQSAAKDPPRVQVVQLIP